MSAIFLFSRYAGQSGSSLLISALRLSLRDRNWVTQFKLTRAHLRHAGALPAIDADGSARRFSAPAHVENPDRYAVTMTNRLRICQCMSQATVL